MGAAKKKRKSRNPQFKEAYVSVSDAQLGWSGPQGGRTVSISFWDGEGYKLGALEVSAARLRWKAAKDKKPFSIDASEIDAMFRKYFDWDE